ncbi:MAG: hypothetical protein HC933_12410 [Pleurocapsa sp. SU_196_0]|nr:hypothetical protein [Pleurocapsa sp. SU_196_0]
MLRKVHSHCRFASPPSWIGPTAMPLATLHPGLQRAAEIRPSRAVSTR